jgi:hypothetical protein
MRFPAEIEEIDFRREIEDEEEGLIRDKNEYRMLMGAKIDSVDKAYPAAMIKLREAAVRIDCKNMRLKRLRDQYLRTIFRDP